MFDADFLLKCIKNTGYKDGYIAKKIGVSTVGFSLWKNRKVDPSISNLVKLGEFFGANYTMFIRKPKGK